MTSKYLEIEGFRYRNGGFRLLCKASFRIDLTLAEIRNAEAVIDTGCQFTSINLPRFHVNENLCRRMKQADIDAGRTFIRSYGVETGGRELIC